MTREEFINSEVMVWGEDYIFDLLDRGYMPVLTSGGYKWVVMSNADYVTKVASTFDTAAVGCYAE